MVVEAAQLLVHRGHSGKVFSDDGVGAQHDEQMSERRTQMVVRPLDRPRTVAVRQVVVEKSSDTVFVDAMDVQPAPARPTRKVRDACQVIANGVGCVPALGQMMRESINVGRQLALKNPVCPSAVKFSDRVHCGLLSWGDHFRTPRKLCRVQPSPTRPKPEQNRRAQTPRICAMCISGFCALGWLWKAFHNAPKPTFAPARRGSGKPSSEQRHVNLQRLEVAAAVASTSDESDLIWREFGGAQNPNIA